MTATPALRNPCPPGVCDCQREHLGARDDARVLWLNRQEEQRLLARLERLESLADLRAMQERLRVQLGIVLQVTPGLAEVRSAKGVVIRLEERPGLCRKLHRSIPAAVRRGLAQRPEILFALLNEHDLLRDA